MHQESEPFFKLPKLETLIVNVFQDDADRCLEFLNLFEELQITQDSDLAELLRRYVAWDLARKTLLPDNSLLMPQTFMYQLFRKYMRAAFLGGRRNENRAIRVLRDQITEILSEIRVLSQYDIPVKIFSNVFTSRLVQTTTSSTHDASQAASFKTRPVQRWTGIVQVRPELINLMRTDDLVERLKASISLR